MGTLTTYKGGITYWSGPPPNAIKGTGKLPVKQENKTSVSPLLYISSLKHITIIQKMLQTSTYIQHL
jgi:hypothetical protein